MDADILIQEATKGIVAVLTSRAMGSVVELGRKVWPWLCGKLTKEKVEAIEKVAQRQPLKSSDRAELERLITIELENYPDIGAELERLRGSREGGQVINQQGDANVAVQAKDSGHIAIGDVTPRRG